VASHAPTPCPTGGPGSRRRALVPWLVAVALAVSCGSAQERYRVLSIFFDGVPRPGAEEASGTGGQAEADAVRTKQIREFVAVDVVHAPYASQECATCHDKMQFEIGGASAAICRQCHDAPTTPPRHEHPPVAEGQCLTCHSPHRSANAHLLREPPADQCGECHDAGDEAYAGRHAALDDPRTPCTACHAGHGGERRGFVTSTDVSLCGACHRRDLQPVRYAHGPVEAGLCSECHEVHDPDARYDLVSSGDALCTRCHDTRGLVARGAHGKKPLDGCTTCHAAHGSERPGLLRPPGAEGAQVRR